MILAFDTATDQLTAALGTVERIEARYHEPAPRAHLGRLLPVIDSLFAKAGRDRRDIDAIAVGIGPGSFTGLRIGVSTAQGLARSLDKPLVGISTLDIVARQVADGRAGGSPESRIFPISDAKRREVYTAEFDGDGKRLGDYRSLYPADLARELEEFGAKAVLAGDGLKRYPDELAIAREAEYAPETQWVPNASVLIALAEERIRLEEVGPYFKVLPIYIRLSDAEENRKREKSS